MKCTRVPCLPRALRLIGPRRATNRGLADARSVPARTRTASTLVKPTYPYRSLDPRNPADPRGGLRDRERAVAGTSPLARSPSPDGYGVIRDPRTRWAPLVLGRAPLLPGRLFRTQDAPFGVCVPLGLRFVGSVWLIPPARGERTRKSGWPAWLIARGDPPHRALDPPPTLAGIRRV